MKRSKALYSGVAAAVAAALAGTAIAQDSDESIDEIVVEGSLNSLPTQDVGSVFGLDKTLLETPRSASTISSDQLDRFDIVDIDELVALAPGTFTQSFFGVAGALDIRGTSGETYFRGVRRLDNPGNYPTPIGASDRIDIVRGPASMIYGPAKIGGYLNFVPKSARADGGQYLDEIEGRVSYTTGSWDRNVITGEVGGPAEIADREFGYYMYGEIEDSESFYQNTATNQTLLQLAIDHDVNESLHIQFGGMYHKYEGNQVAGWNRLTQDLIDNGTYITGLAQPLDTNGDGSISHDEYNVAGISQFFVGTGSVTQADINPLSALENPGTAQLDGSQVLVAPDDTLDNEVMTLYFDAIYDTAGGWEIKNQLFFEKYDNLNENAYGFSQFHDSWVIEDKLVFQKAFEFASGTSTLQVSPSIRHTDFNHGSDFINEYFDRRDLTGPSTARDRRLLATRSGTDFADRYEGDYTNLGLAVLGDFVFDNGFSALFGIRYDTIDVESTSIDEVLLFPGSNPLFAEDDESGISWTASLSWDFELTDGNSLIPYFTASEQSTVIAGQGAEIQTGAIIGNGWFDTSELMELGIKGSFLDDSLYMALSIYEQERTDFNAQAIVTNQSNRTEGVELEARWVVNENLVLTAGYTHIEVVNLNTLENAGRFSFFGADDIPQIDPASIFGGQAIGIVFSDGEAGARRAGMPENIFSFTGTYAFDNGIAVNGSVVSVDSVFSGFSQAVELPSYTLVNAGIVYETDNWQFALTGKNLTDERYFRANFPNLFGSQIVLPELPRNWQASVSFSF
ncbi:MAG: TonB-dependent receptor plug domain-containing protein [Pseudomonadota bacterium]